MPRALKTFATIAAQSREAAQPKTNQFTLDLGGLSLTDDQLARVRQEAVKAALGVAGELAQTLDSFSTFSTFSTFGSGSSGMNINPAIQAGGMRLPQRVTNVIENVVRPQ